MANFRRWIVSLCTQRKAGATEQEWKNIRLSFSQFGEDLVLEHLLPNKGFYVDIGANHPVTHSNTWLFYRNGWRGIVVEPNPQLAKLHRHRRPRDVVIEVAAGRKSGWGKLLLGESHLTSRVEAGGSAKAGGSEISISIKTLRQILKEHLPKGVQGGLLNVDCEGMDLQVLQGNDWRQWRPAVICAEAKTRKEERDLCRYLESKRYRFVGRVFYSVIYQDIETFARLFPEL
jgi:FkbM family methyltransferase